MAEIEKVDEKQKKVEDIKHKNIFEALSAFQGEMKPIEQDGSVDFKKKNSEERVQFKYSTLGKIMEVINPVLGKHGLSVRWEISDKAIECIVNHATTQYEKVVIGKKILQNNDAEHPDEMTGKSSDIEYKPYNSNQITSGKLPLDLTQSDMKEVGGQITYGRRYTLGLALGIATDEDKDATLVEESSNNAKSYAFKKALEGIKNIPIEKLEEQIVFIKDEMSKAEAIKAGTGKKAPALGLSVEQYAELLKIAEERLSSINNQA